MDVCPTCGSQNRDGAAACQVCGDRLDQAPGREERKLVTVLFADLVGFTATSEDMDVEDVRRILVPYHRIARRELERFGGTVEKFIGDAVVGIFGAPVSHEDDPKRAVLAALAIQRAIERLRETDERLDLQVRIGVNTGEALVALAADPLAGEGLASGDAINTAARIQAAAPAGGVLVGEMTRRATAQGITYEPAEPVVAKGKRDPVTVWRAVAAEEGEQPSPRHLTPLSGRRAELDTLLHVLDTVLTERRPRLVTLSGVPGIGKSRLVHELAARVRSQGRDVVHRHGRSLPYGQGTTYWALGEVVRGEAGILHSDAGSAVSAKLERSVRGVVADERDAAWVEGHLRPLLGLEPRPGAGIERPAEAFAAWRLFLEALARRGPLVLVLEDLHWADDSLLDFVDQLLEWGDAVPLLVVCTTRPDLYDRRPGWGGGPQAANLALAPLPDGDTADLMSRLLDGAPLPEDVAAALLERAGGNPLYAQELVRMLVDRGLLARGDGGWSLAGPPDLPLPESLYGIIAARLDALPADEKAAIQDASVIGRVVWTGAVAHVAERDPRQVEKLLRGLVGRELLRLEGASSVEHETQYAFQHALVRDVAYSQIVRPARAGKHARAASWIESLGDDHGDRAELLAHHYLAALELHAATGADPGDLSARAWGALVEAADRALAISAYAAAARLYASAFALLADPSEAAPELRWRHARARMYSEGILPAELLAAAEELAAAGDSEAAAEAESDAGIWLDQHGDKASAMQHLQRAVALLAGRPPSAAKASALSSLASVYVLSARLDEGVAAAREALEIATRLELDDLRAWSHQTTALGWLQQQDARAGAEFERAVRIARGLESYDGVMIEHNYGVWQLATGDLAGARETQTAARRRSARLGIGLAARLVDATLMCIAYHTGDWDTADRLAGDDPGAEDESAHASAIDAHTVRARMALARGDDAAATRHASRALNLARETGEPQNLVPALAVAAYVRLCAGRPDEAAGLIDELLGDAWMGVSISSEALAAAGAAAARLPDVRDRFARAAAAFSLPNRWMEAAGALAIGEHLRAAGVYAAVGSRADEALARLLASRALRSAGQDEAAAAELGRSDVFWQSVGARAYAADV